MSESYSKLLPLRMRPFWVIEVMSTRVMIDENDIRSTVSVDRALVAPAVKKKLTKDSMMHGDVNEAEQEEARAGDTR